MKLKKSIVTFSIVVINVITFSSEIPIDSIIKKPKIRKVSLSLDGKYIAALYTGSNDQKQLLTYKIDTKERKVLKPASDLNVYKYSWASNDHLVYYISQQKGMYICYCSSTDRDLTLESRKIIIGAQTLTGVVDGLLADPDNILFMKWYQSRYTLFGKMNIHKARFRKEDKLRGEMIWQMTDFNGTLRLVNTYSKKSNDAQGDYLYRDSINAPWEKIELDKEEDYYCFTTDGQGLYVGTYKQPTSNKYHLDYNSEEQTYKRNKKTEKKTGKTKSLYIYNIRQNNLEQAIFSDSVFDFNGRLRFFGNPYNPSSFTLKGITQWNDTVVTSWYDKKIETIQHKLDSCIPNSINLIYDADTSLSRFLFKSYSDIKRSEYYIYDVNNDKISLLFKSCPWIKPELMSKTKTVTFQTRDTLTLHGYLTLPKTGKPPFPTVILSHGGPHARDYWGFDTEVQVLASRGYAVFQINYRGSTGFGYRISVQEKYNFHKMYLDIVDGTNYLIDEGIVDKKKIAVMGASFGGYLTLCGITFEPDLYCCAISNVGVFDWRKQLRSDRFEYNSYVYDYYASYLGGGNNKAYLDSISPIHKIKNIKVPVLLTGGSEDTRVSISQSFDLSNKLKRAGVKVETYFKAYEGHGFGHQKNITEYYKRVLDFLSRNMTGKETE